MCLINVSKILIFFFFFFFLTRFPEHLVLFWFYIVNFMIYIFSPILPVLPAVQWRGGGGDVKI